MASSAQLAVPHGATPTKLATTNLAGSDASGGGDTLCLYNSGTVTVQLGGPDVTTSNGFRALIAGATLVLDIGAEGIYGVVTGSTDGAVDVLRAR